MSDPALVTPAVDYQSSYLSAVEEYIAEGCYRGWRPDLLAADFPGFIDVLRQAETDPLPGMPPQSHFWLVTAHTIIGDTQIRHYLTPELHRTAGHISYRIRPSMRRQGYGRLICQLALEEAHRLKLARVLLICDEDHHASRRIIEACGGVLQDVLESPGSVPVCRYWIELTAG